MKNKHPLQENYNRFFKTKLAESINEYETVDSVIFAVDNAELDDLLNDKFRASLEFEKVQGEQYYKLPQRLYDKFSDMAEKYGFSRGKNANGDWYEVDEDLQGEWQDEDDDDDVDPAGGRGLHSHI